MNFILRRAYKRGNTKLLSFYNAGRILANITMIIYVEKIKLEERNRFGRERALCSTFLIISLSQIQKENQLI